MAQGAPIITFLTDFGESDGYVGAMKGVILGIVPDAHLVDITHQVQPQQIRQAAHILASTYMYFPGHTVHLVVVDPGVGGQRRGIALETPRGRFVAPDNGVLSYVCLQEPSWQAVVLDQPRHWLVDPSYTFHGRDIFSPVAAHLARGVPLADLGSPLESPVLFDLPLLEVTPGVLRGEVVRIDHFGNVVTSIDRLTWVEAYTVEFCPPALAGASPVPLRFDSRKARVSFGWHSLNGLYHTYSQVPVGQALALIGSNGALELAVNQGNAASKLAIQIGDPVTLSFEPADK